jgi:hypothetical protein
MKFLNPIQLISHLHLALLNICHSPSNIRLEAQVIIATFMAKENDVEEKLFMQAIESFSSSNNFTFHGGHAKKIKIELEEQCN